MISNEKNRALADDRREGETMDLLGRELHTALFVEEYDHIYDSASEAKDRQRGVNPMGIEYIKKTNAYRAALGFVPLQVGRVARNDDTFAWVREKLQQGEEAQLRQIIENRARETRDCERRKEQAQQNFPTNDYLDQMIDDMLAGSKFIRKGQDRTEPKIIAFRILGELFSMKVAGNKDIEFFRQIRRLLPDQSETEYQALHQNAMNDWMEVYGY